MKRQIYYTEWNISKMENSYLIGTFPESLGKSMLFYLSKCAKSQVPISQLFIFETFSFHEKTNLSYT